MCASVHVGGRRTARSDIRIEYWLLFLELLISSGHWAKFISTLYSSFTTNPLSLVVSSPHLMGEKTEVQTGDPPAFCEVAGKRGSRMPIHQDHALSSHLRPVGCPCPWFKDQVEYSHHSVSGNFVAWDFLSISVRGLQFLGEGGEG